MVTLLALRRGKTYSSLVDSLPVKYFEDDSEFIWDVISSSRRNIPLVEVRDESGTPVAGDTMVGAGYKPFYLVFPEDWSIARPLNK